MQLCGTHLQRMIVPRASRGFATASIRDRFEAAYVQRRESMNKGPVKVQDPVDKERYGKSYYQDKLSQMKNREFYHNNAGSPRPNNLTTPIEKKNIILPQQ